MKKIFLILFLFFSSSAFAECLISDCYNGFGVSSYFNGTVYVGNFKNHEWQGNGKIIYPDKSIHIGYFENNKKNGEGVFIYPGGNVFFGEFLNNKKNGEGTLLYSNGDQFIGEWSNDVRTGSGNLSFSKKNNYEDISTNFIIQNQGDRIYFSESILYEGEIIKNKNKNLKILLYSNGNKYIGEWHNGKKHGQGTSIFFNGNKYTGEYKRNIREGEGVFLHYNGDLYVGNFKNNLRHGKGTYFFSNGEQYHGEWKNDKREGYGTVTIDNPNLLSYIPLNSLDHEKTTDYNSMKNRFINLFTKDPRAKAYKNQDIIFSTDKIVKGPKYSGEWKNNMKNGMGTTIFGDGTKYIGEFKNNYRNGMGTMTYPSGDTYSGSWKDNEKNGYGVFAYLHKNPMQYHYTVKSIWKNDVPVQSSWWSAKIRCTFGDCINGYGVYKYTNGQIYKGEFKNYLWHGKGHIFYPNKDIYIGDFINDNKHGKGVYIFASGETYDGEWINDRKNGKGTYTYTYRGLKTLNEKNKVNHTDEDLINFANHPYKYVGYFKDDKREGEGYYLYLDDMALHGTWKEDELVGDSFTISNDYIK